MDRQEVEILAIGAGPANLALAVAVEELAGPELAAETMIVEQHDDILWQRGMLLPWTQSQVSFLKDLVTLRNPRSEFSFVNYLHSMGRLDEFINLGSFTPYRLEISSYLQWVAKSLRYVQIEYGRRCVSIEPVVSEDGGVHHWSVRTADGGEIICRTLVMGAGRDPHIPAEIGALPRNRIIHSTEYASRCAEFDPDGAHRVVVVGGAQSAAEMFWATYQGFPNAQVTMVMRSIGLNTYESSKFTNELFYPSFVDEFHAALPEAREQLLREMHRTNYAGLAPGMLETLYREMYQQRLLGTERLHMITMTEISGARLDGDDVVVSLTDRKTRRTQELRCDVVLLGTGFVRGMPKLIQDLAVAAGVGGATVDRNYRMNLPPSYTAGCYLQGVNEATHGIADSLLSVLAVRAQDIVYDLLAHLERKPAPELVLGTS
ncbi:SidA/IucD/PvdA family monooxygenase [Microbispora sp. NPDC046973]|uniref:lysine N(6)-hydroxylase/L-ornithine N(5)-oxygenase family protein n=1 Tax=Microbispora sp. NPDC046973 TaxID=3155022 RepID=UPI0033E86ADE